MVASREKQIIAEAQALIAALDRMYGRTRLSLNVRDAVERLRPLVTDNDPRDKTSA